MTRSLLALAGAAVTLRDWKKGIFPPPENDGLLTAQQAAGLNLDRTWLVVLSACDTGDGEARTGEGVLGLRRGFAEAGAQNLLMTLWTADDAETADLMAGVLPRGLQPATRRVRWPRVAARQPRGCCARNRDSSKPSARPGRSFSATRTLPR